MSFGVGFGDIAKAVGLAREVVTRYREAPKHVNDLATEISARLNTLEVADVALRQRHGDSASAALDPVLQGYVTRLERLRRMHDESQDVSAAAGPHGFRGKVRVVGKRLTFDPNQIKSCREQIGHYNGMLDSFMTSLNLTIAEDTELSKEHEELLAWLTPPTMDSKYGEIHTERLRKRVGETGNWFPALAEFEGWIHEPRTTLLCLGIPGAGKSILSSVAIHHLQGLQEVSPAAEPIGVGFILFDFKSNDEPEDVLACLLAQLVRPKKAPPDLRSLFLRYKSRPKGSRPLMKELIDCLCSAVASSYTRSFVVIDALDEYEGGRRSVFLEAMFHLQKSVGLNLFATLRPIQEITALFGESGIVLHKIQIDAKDDDIRLFLDCRMREEMSFLRSVSKEAKGEIIAEISEASTGIFLLAELYLQSIKKCHNVAKARKVVRNLPKGPNAYGKLYGDTIQRIRGKESRELAMHVLSWAGWARRPLTVQELQHALAIIEDELVLDEDNTTAEEAIVSVCEGLITVDAQTHIIRLIHFTAREYLEGIGHDIFPTVECDILDVCLGLISSSAFETGRCQTDEEFAARLSAYPLYDYAVKNWGLHAHSIALIRENSILLFLQSNPNVEAASQGLLAWEGFSQHTPAEVSGLHLAVWFGLKPITEKLLSQGFYSANERNTYGQSALAVAASRGFPDIIRVLLAHTAEVDTSDRMSRTPLSLAAERGDVEMVKVLMSHAANPCTKDMFNRSPLSYAAESGSEATIRCLLNHAEIVAVMNHPDQARKTPVWYAAAEKHWGVMRQLVANQAHIDFPNEDGVTLLSLAAANEQWDDVRELIKVGAFKADLPDTTGRTLLSLAAEHCQEDVTTALLALGADQTIPDSDGWTPLTWASDSGWCVGVTMLLRQNPVCLMRQDRHGQTALSIASSMGHKAVVETLLDWDKEKNTINVADKTGWTPLIQAAKNGGDVLDAILDKAGNHVDAKWKDSAGKTALHWAAARGNLKAVARLIRLVEVDGLDNLQRTALWLAATNGHDAVVGTLLACGADANMADRLQRTPLRSAVERGHEKVVEELLRWKGYLEIGPTLCGSIRHLVCLTASLGVWNALDAAGLLGDDGKTDVLGLVALFS